MALNKKLAVVGLATWLVSYLIAKSSKSMRRREASLYPQQVTTWEGEGGNLPPAQSNNVQPALH